MSILLILVNIFEYKYIIFFLILIKKHKMKKTILALLLVLSLYTNAQEKTLITTTPDGRITLSMDGIAYFTKLSLSCANKVYPHYYNEHAINSAADLKTPDKFWPSFYGCYDWHSGVHNHWALVKLLKTYPKAPDANAIKAKLEQSFDAQNILKEIEYFKSHEEENFEFPYGTSWLLKVADELMNWDDPIAKKWLKNLEPLTAYLASSYLKVWPTVEQATYTGNHFASSLGLSFALDYARSAKNDSLEKLIISKAKFFFNPGERFFKAYRENLPLDKEPFNYDFMSAGLLITDLMRKVLPQNEYEVWLKKFAPELLNVEDSKKALHVERLADHSGFSSHYDGFHLNRIWCLNGMMKSLSTQTLTPEIKKQWINAQKEMWDYAQESIGKGNYDIDHWLSSFSVFALIGYEK